ncbi:calcium-binding protein [Thioalkalivibrio sp. ALJ7]|uniref:calcium-binding protein n=1 Tax=Thioalkalivibrio sp. ALJ7 TaxID=1158756 RepID=UPI0003723B10|nr:calcium-binding protein [Thioalkalivibrio sp. ALJ7]
MGGPAGILESAWDYWTGGDFIGDIRDFFNRGQSHASPIILDLDGNGISTVGLDAGVQFDHNGDGFAQATGWVGPGDALLAMDLTGNEEIETGSELFGNASEIEEGVTAMNGFEALAIHDTNDNGRIDPGDKAWGDLRLWQDANGNGVVDEGELLTLDEVGIGSIDLGYSDSTYVDEHGNEHRQIGRFEWADGREGEATDVWFIQDTAITEARERLDIPEAIAILPDLMGYGEVHDLHQALVRDESGQLRGEVEAFMAETDVKAREARMESLLYEWAGASDVDPEGRGSHIDGRKVATLEAFLGREFRQHGSPNPRVMASGELRAAFDILQTTMYAQMMRQTHLAPYLEGMDLVFDEDGIRIDFAGTTEALNQQFDADPARGVADLLELQRATGEQLSPMGFDSHGLLRDWLAQAGDDPAVLEALADFGWDGVRTDGEGTAASEIVFASNDGAELTAGSGGDWVLGGDGDDVLQAGSGDDILYGGSGNNTYRFDVGQGHNTIIEMHGAEGHSVLEFGPEIRAGDLDIRAEGSSLVLAHSNGRDSVTIENWFGSADSERHRINTLRFADGHSFDLSALQLGSTEGDELTGGEENAILVGNEGENILTGGTGDNWLHGGRDADVLVGGEGDNLFVVRHRDDQVIAESGDGTNTVQSHVSFALSDNLHNLTLLGRSGISATGNELDNVLIGNSGNNRLDGVAGANTMIGGRGNNTYVVHSADDVVIEKPGEGNDTVESHIDYVLPDNVENLHLQGSEDLHGTGNELNNELIGNTGDNVLNGVEGNNYIDGRGGANIMIGGAGDDTYVVRSDDDVVIEQPGEGHDTIRSSVTYTLPDNVEDLILTGSADIDGTGNELDNYIQGNNGDNVLNGVAGANVMAGGRGDNTYILNSEEDVVIEKPNQGTDTVISPFDYTLPDNVENLTLVGEARVGRGNDEDNIIIGTERPSHLYGVSGNNVLIGGGRSANFLYGGDGDNTYVVSNPGTKVIAQENGGTDTVKAETNFRLPDHVDNLTLIGDGDYRGWGNELDNVLIGNDGDNVLRGEGGDNFIHGGRGNNVLYGGAGSDTYFFERGDGHDRIVERARDPGEDTLLLGEDIAADQLWFRQDGRDLSVEVIGTEDRITVDSWFGPQGETLDQVELSSGEVLTASEVNNLVQAMAAFDPPGADESRIPEAYREQLQPVVASAWQ